jgi:hypothetical protein
MRADDPVRTAEVTDALEALGVIDEIREVDHGARLGLQKTTSRRGQSHGIWRSNCRGGGKLVAIPAESNLSEAQIRLRDSHADAVRQRDGRGRSGEMGEAGEAGPPH